MSLFLSTCIVQLVAVIGASQKLIPHFIMNNFQHAKELKTTYTYNPYTCCPNLTIVIIIIIMWQFVRSSVEFKCITFQ